MNQLDQHQQEALRRILVDHPVHMLSMTPDQGGYRVDEKVRITHPSTLANAPIATTRGRVYTWSSYTETDSPEPPHVILLMTCEIYFERLSVEQVDNATKAWADLFASMHAEVLAAVVQVAPPSSSAIRAAIEKARQRLHEDHQIALETSAQAALHEKRKNAAIDHAYLAKRFDCDETNLWCLTEEAGEVVRSCGKIGRWGYDHVHQITGESGMRLLESEVGDFLALVEIMIARGHFTRKAIHKAVLAKLERLEDWYDAPMTPADRDDGVPVDADGNPVLSEDELRKELADALRASQPARYCPNPTAVHRVYLSGMLGVARECMVEGFDHTGTYRLSLKPLPGAVYTPHGIAATWNPTEGIFEQIISTPPPVTFAKLMGVDWGAPEGDRSVGALVKLPGPLSAARHKPKYHVYRRDGTKAQGWLVDGLESPLRMILDTDQLIHVHSYQQALFEVEPPAEQPTTWGTENRLIEEDADGEALMRRVKFIANDPEKRKLTVQNGGVWLKDAGGSCVWAPGFHKIIAPTYDSEFDLEL